MSRFSMSLCLAAGLLTAGSAMATPVYVGHIWANDSYGSIGGGEFRITGQADFTLNPRSTGTAFQFGAPPGINFESFCLEKFEGLPFEIQDFKADLNTETVSQAADYQPGNPAGTHGGANDPLDARTAYLYAGFINMTLTSGYDYLNAFNRTNDADALQTAIWFIEEEDATPLSGKALAFFNEAQAAVSSGAWVGLGDVRVLNIYTNTARADYQDLLVMIPLPGGAAMAGLGLGGLAMIRRRPR